MNLDEINIEKLHFDEFKKNSIDFLDKIKIISILEIGQFYSVGYGQIINNNTLSTYFIKKYYDENRYSLIDWLINFVNDIKLYIIKIENLNYDTIIINDYKIELIYTIKNELIKMKNGLKNISLTYPDDQKVSTSIEFLINKINNEILFNKINLKNKIIDKKYISPLGLLTSTNSFKKFKKNSLLH